MAAVKDKKAKAGKALKEETSAQVGKREAARKAKADAEAAKEKALLESGDLIVKGDGRYYATPSTGRVADVVRDVVPMLRKATKVPVTSGDFAEKLDYKYPEDLAPAFYALEALGAIKRYTVRTAGAGRATPAYLWVGE